MSDDIENSDDGNEVELPESVQKAHEGLEQVHMGFGGRGDNILQLNGRAIYATDINRGLESKKYKNIGERQRAGLELIQTRQRRIIEMHIESYSYDEIAAETGYSKARIREILNSPLALAVIGELNEKIEAGSIAEAQRIKEKTREARDLLYNAALEGKLVVKGAGPGGEDLVQIVPVGVRVRGLSDVMDRDEEMAKVQKQIHKSGSDEAIDALHQRLREAINRRNLEKIDEYKSQEQQVANAGSGSPSQ